MNKRNIKNRAAAVLAALLACCLVGTASAATGKVMRELEYRNIKVSLDGKILDLRNAAGEKVEPFMFGGTNYLPVRALAEALGLHVAWDSPNSMVVLTTPGVKSGRQEFTGDIGDHHIEITGAKLSYDIEGEPIIIITYQWTNNTEETTIAYGTISDVAFQDGIELDGYDLDDLYSGMEPAVRWVRPGATLEMKSAYYLTGDGALQFEVYEYGGFSDDGEAVYAYFDPTTLEMEVSGEPATPGYVSWQPGA